MTNLYRLAAGAALAASLFAMPATAAEIKKGQVGSVFRDRLKDGSAGPEMVVIPSGKFRMGAIFGGGDPDEKPVHWVVVPRAFSMGKYEVTFEEYDRFCSATGREKPKDGRRWFGPLSRDWGRGRMPVMNVSWDDADAYTKWLSAQTGQKYRLPSESEWEFAARGGKDTPFWWGGDRREKPGQLQGVRQQMGQEKGGAGGLLRCQPLWSLRYGGQCLGMVHRHVARRL